MKAQLVLGLQLNRLWNIESMFLSKFRDLPNRHQHMTFFWQDASPLDVDYDSLSFLLTTERSNLVSEINVAEGSFRTAVTLLRIWNQTFERLHARSRLEQMNPETGECRISADLRDIKLLEDAANHLFTSVDDATVKCDNAIKSLKEAGKAIFPKARFLTIEKDTPPNSSK